ncbi:MAG: hypothetical protein WCL59_09395, partial [Cyanobium sp. ELA507]
DYLLKPFKPERFQAALARARDHLSNQQASTAARGLLELLADDYSQRDHGEHILQLWRRRHRLLQVVADHQR